MSSLHITLGLSVVAGVKPKLLEMGVAALFHLSTPTMFAAECRVLATTGREGLLLGGVVLQYWQPHAGSMSEERSSGV